MNTYIQVFTSREMDRQRNPQRTPPTPSIQSPSLNGHVSVTPSVQPLSSSVSNSTGNRQESIYISERQDSKYGSRGGGAAGDKSLVRFDSGGGGFSSTLSAVEKGRPALLAAARTSVPDREYRDAENLVAGKLALLAQVLALLVQEYNF